MIAIFVENGVKEKESLQFGDGLQTRDFVYVDDVVDGLYAALNIDCRGEIYIGSGVESTLLEVRENIEKALGEKIKIKEKPKKIGELRRSCLSYQRAKDVLNWEPKIN